MISISSNITIHRGYFEFDTSGLPDGATVTSAKVRIRGASMSNISYVSIQKGTQDSPLSSGDWNEYSGSAYTNTTSWSTTAYNDFTLNAQGRSDIKTDGTTKYVVRDYNNDYSDVVPSAFTDFQSGCFFSEYPGTSHDPRLEIEYEEGGGEEYEETVAYAAKGSVAIGLGYRGYVAYGSKGEISIGPKGSYLSEISVDGSGELSAQCGLIYSGDIGFGSAGAVFAAAALGYLEKIGISGIGDLEASSEKKLIGDISFASSAEIDVSENASYSYSIDFTGISGVSFSRELFDTELIIYSGRGKVEASTVGTYSLAFEMGAEGSVSIAGPLNLRYFSNISCSADIEISHILGQYAIIDLNGKGSFEVDTYTGSVAVVEYLGRGEASVVLISQYSEIIDAACSGSVGISIVADYTRTLLISSESETVVSDTVSDIEIIIAEGGGFVTTEPLASYYRVVSASGLSFATISGRLNRFAAVEWSSHSEISLYSKTDFTYGANLTSASSVLIQDLWYDTELLLIRGEGFVLIQDIEILDFASKAGINAYTIWLPPEIAFASFGLSSIHASADYTVTAEISSKGLLEYEDYTEDSELLEMVGKGGANVQSAWGLKRTLNAVGICEIKILSAGEYLFLGPLFGHSLLDFNASLEYSGEKQIGSTGDIGIEIRSSYHENLEVSGSGEVTIHDTYADTEIIYLASESKTFFVDVEHIDVFSDGIIYLRSECSGITRLFWSIVVLRPGGAEIDLSEGDRIEYARFTDEKGKRSDYFEIVINNNDGMFSKSFQIGDQVFFYVDENGPRGSKIFHGLVTSIEFDLETYRRSRIILSGEDYGSIRMGQTLITGAENYTNKTASDIVQDLLLRYCPEITTHNLEDFINPIRSMFFAWEYVGQAIDKVADLVGADYYVDENDDLHFYNPENLSPAHSIRPSQVARASIKRDAMKYFDRIFVVGGKQGFLDYSQAEVESELSLHEKSLAAKFIHGKSNLLNLDFWVKKIGNPLDDIQFTVVEDNAGDPTGSVTGFGQISRFDVFEEGSWVSTSLLDTYIDITKQNWIVFSAAGDQGNTFLIGHDDESEDGHKTRFEGGPWTSGKGKPAIKTYYGIQLVKSSIGEKKMFKHHTDVPIIDINIQQADTALQLAQQKAIEYALKNASDLTINPFGRRLKAGQVLEFRDIPGMAGLENQTILSVAYEVRDKRISSVKVKCTAADDFYTAFANLFSELRRLKVKNLLESQEKTTDYLAVTESPQIESVCAIVEADMEYEVSYDDERATWDVSLWN